MHDLQAVTVKVILVVPQAVKASAHTHVHAHTHTHTPHALTIVSWRARLALLAQCLTKNNVIKND